MTDKPITKFILSTEAQNNFGRLLDDVAARGTRYIVKRFGTPRAVIISMEDFENLLASDAEGQRTLQILRESRPEYALGETIGAEATAEGR